MNKVVLVASGPVQIEALRYVFEDAYVVCVDGGLHHLDQIGIVPEVIIGDFDSANHELLEKYRDQSTIYNHPTKKDRTDSEIAIDYAIELSPKEVVLLGMTGHRMDHMITNIHLLKRFWNHDILAYVLDNHNKVYYCKGDLELQGKVGDLLSIIPLTSYVSHIKTFGLEYPLDDETLHFHESRGVSNVFSNEKVRIETGVGEFLVILSKD